MTHADRPFEVLRLDHVVLRTGQMPAMLGFYESLGAVLMRDLRDRVGLVQLRLGESMIDLLDVDDRAQDVAASIDGRNMDHFAVRIEPFDEAAILSFCATCGIKAQALSMPIMGADGFGPAVYLQDPDGNRVELKGPPNEDQSPPELR